jgi:hypothetical protein
MRRWLGPLGIALCVGLGAPAPAQAVFFSAAPTISQPQANDFTPVVFEFFFHADGHTAGVSLVDLYLDLTNPALIGSVTANTNGNATLGAGASQVAPDLMLLTASDVVSLLPTPTGTEVFKLGELVMVHAGVEGVVDIMLNSNQTVIFDTLAFDTTLIPTNAPFEILATLDIGANIVIGAPEPAPVGLMLASILGILVLRHFLAA